MKIDIKKLLRRLSFVIIILLLSPQFCSSQEVIDRIVAKVNESIITLSDLNKRLMEDPKYEQLKYSLQKEEFQRLMLDQMITEKLLLARADELDIKVNEDELNRQLMKLAGDVKTIDELKEVMKEQNIDFEVAKKKFMNDIRIQRLLATEVYIKTEVADSEVDELSKNSFDNIEIKGRQIIVKIPEGSDQSAIDALHKKAKEAYDQLLKGKDFVEVSKEYSDAQNKNDGGDMGFIRKGWLPENFEKALFSLETGAVSNIIETKFGFYILQALEKKSMNIDEATLKNKIAKEREEKLYKEYIEKLKAGSIIKIIL
jgi:parvulin-like peptidyl-prolyl isomerase